MLPLQILIADDDVDDLDLLEEAILEVEPNSAIDKVASGRLVLPHLHNYPDTALPDLIILDYNMPEITGAELLKLIGLEPRFEGVPKVIWSTSSAQLHIDECLNKGATDYFVKPTSKSQLNNIIRKLFSLMQNYQSSEGK